MNFNEAMKAKRQTISRLAEASDSRAAFIRKLKKRKHPITEAVKRIFEPILGIELDLEVFKSERLKSLEAEVQKELDCLLDRCDNLLVATAWENGKRVRVIIRTNQLKLDNKFAIKNEAKGLIYELNNKLNTTL